MKTKDVLAEPVVQVTIEAVRLAALLGQHFTQAYTHTGLLRLELMVLVAVAAAPGPPTVPQIGRATGHARQSVQKAANALQKAGLIQTSTNPNHKRARLLILSEAGQQVADGIMSRGGAIAQQLLVHLDRDRLVRLYGELQSLRLTLEQYRAGGQPADAPADNAGRALSTVPAVLDIFG